MSLRMPKPPNGWNTVAWDLAIVTVGVLVALAAQQLVDSWEWQHKVGIVRQSLMGELGNDRARWEYDLTGARCALREGKKLDEWASHGAIDAPPPIPFIANGQILAMHTSNWTLAAGGETLDHFPVREQLAYAGLYAGIANRQVSIGDASGAMDRIQTLVPLATDGNARRELREAVGDLRTSLLTLFNNDRYMRRHFDALHVSPDWSDFAADVQPSGSACAGESERNLTPRSSGPHR